MLGFMVVAPHDLSTNLINDLKSYLDPDAFLLVGFETCDKHEETQGQHYHFCVNPMTDQQYDKFRKTILVNKMKLSGQAKNGRPRQYGKIKNIRSETQLMNYTVKSKNIYYENIDLKTIQECISNSYEKPKTPKDFVSDLMVYLNEHSESFYIPGIEVPLQYSLIELAILEYYRKMNVGKAVSKTTLKSLTTRYLMYHYDCPECNNHLISTKDIYYYIYS